MDKTVRVLMIYTGEENNLKLRYKSNVGSSGYTDDQFYYNDLNEEITTFAFIDNDGKYWEDNSDRLKGPISDLKDIAHYNKDGLDLKTLTSIRL